MVWTLQYFFHYSLQNSQTPNLVWRQRVNSLAKKSLMVIVLLCSWLFSGWKRTSPKPQFSCSPEFLCILLLSFSNTHSPGFRAYCRKASLSHFTTTFCLTITPTLQDAKQSVRYLPITIAKYGKGFNWFLHFHIKIIHFLNWNQETLWIK